MDAMVQARILSKMLQDTLIRKGVQQVLMTYEESTKKFNLVIGYPEGKIEEAQDELLFNCFLKIKNS